MEGHGNLESCTWARYIVTAYDFGKLYLPADGVLLIQTEHTASDDPHAPINWVGVGLGGGGALVHLQAQRFIPSHIKHLFIAMDSFLSHRGSLSKNQAKRLGGCN